MGFKSVSKANVPESNSDKIMFRVAGLLFDSEEEYKKISDIDLYICYLYSSDPLNFWDKVHDPSKRVYLEDFTDMIKVIKNAIKKLKNVLL